MVDSWGSSQAITRRARKQSLGEVRFAWIAYRDSLGFVDVRSMGLDRSGCRRNAPPFSEVFGQCDEAQAASEAGPAHSGSSTALETD